ncbi:hypothetical protein [Nocardia aurantia]|uniref:Uncharacterized protein n=1 Tax=Nocardia aurantia TaxID=2585199 RepID=A0A7K0DVI2_9NOCA|nr:hypothetical protein [Nocardia aurantia]MQY29793.1 hypothetical protein [Nocardia aurantia]
MKKLILATLTIIVLWSTIDYSRTAGHLGIPILIGVVGALLLANLATQ